MQYAVWSLRRIKLPLDNGPAVEYQDSHTVCSMDRPSGSTGGDDEEMLPMTQTIPGSAAQNGVADPPAAAETISGGHLVAKALKAEGVDTIYTLCGGDHLRIYHRGAGRGIALIP